jgi:hypothetical protein
MDDADRDGRRGGGVLIKSWQEALAIFGEDLRYNANGVLVAPCVLIDDVGCRTRPGR